MPNWCYNHLEISSWNSYSLPDEYTELKTGSKKKSDYDIEIENRKKDAEKQIKQFIKDNIIDGVFKFSHLEPLPKELEDIKSGGYTDDNGVQHREWREVDGNKIPITKLEKDQLKRKYGYDNWYDWNVANYGTKWDVEVGAEIVEDDEVDINFETAWSPPFQWLEKATEKYPLLTFKMKYDEEAEQFMGVAVARNGTLYENIVDVNYPRAKEITLGD